MCVFSYLSSVVSFASLRRPATENKKQVVESKLFDPIKGRSTIVFPDDNVAWQSLALEKGFRGESVSHQRKQFTRTVSETTRRQASKDWMPQGFHPSEKKNGHTCQSWMLAHLVYQWAWRQSIGSCSPAEFLEHLHELVHNLCAEEKFSVRSATSVRQWMNLGWWGLNSSNLK